MLTPDTISSKRFDKQMGGYKQDEVENFLRQVAEEYSHLQAEKEELESKIEVLAEKVEQYREDEDSLRNALIGAQKLGDSVIRESKAKAEYIIREAKIKSERMMETAQKNIEKEHMALIKMQKEVTKFKNRLLTLYKQHLEMISALPDYEQEEDLSPDIDAAVNKADGLSMPDRNSEPERTERYREKPQESNFVLRKEEIEEVHSPIPQVEVQQEPERPEPQPQPAVPQNSGIYRNEVDSGMVIDFNTAIEQQESNGYSQAMQMVPQQSNDSKFGPLKFGEGFDVERDSAGKSLFSRKKHR